MIPSFEYQITITIPYRTHGDLCSMDMDRTHGSMQYEHGHGSMQYGYGQAIEDRNVDSSLTLHGQSSHVTLPVVCS